jgi:hypothetical protein
MIILTPISIILVNQFDGVSLDNDNILGNRVFFVWVRSRAHGALSIRPFELTQILKKSCYMI